MTASTDIQDSDAEFEDNDNDVWSDAEELDSIQNQYKDSNITTEQEQNQEEQQKCWICTFCAATNNLRLTLDQYSMKCGTCTQTQYSLETPIIMSNTWDHPEISTPKDCVVSPQLPSFWSCVHCTYHNTNMDSDCCEICRCKQATKLPWQCSFCNYKNIGNKKYICTSCDFNFEELNTETQSNKEYEATYQEENQDEDAYVETEDEDEDIQKGPKWQCPNCLYHTFDWYECDKCECNKPQKMIHWNSMEYCVFGYCRRECDVFVPVVVKKLIEKYGDKVATYDIFGNILIKSIYSAAKWKPHSLNCKMKEFACFTKKVYQIMGTYIAKNMFTVYRWSFELCCNDSYVFVDPNNTKGAMIRKIKIGVCDIANNMFIGMGSFDKLQLAQSNSKYCRALRNGDIITMELNMMKKTLGYAINDEWFGVYRRVQESRYRAEIYVYSEGVTVHNIGFMRKRVRLKKRK